MKLNIPEFLAGTFLFERLCSDEIQALCRDIKPEICDFSKNGTVLCRESYERRLGFVVSGEIEVRRKREDGALIPLNNLTKGASFGILSLFSKDEEFPTEIVAKKASTVLFLTKADVTSLISKSPAVSINVIEFLSERVAFLNRKLGTFSAASVEDKLKRFIQAEGRRLGNEFPLNCKKTAEKLGVGRASLYRALEHLQSVGYIKFCDRKINILHQETKGTKK